MGAYGIAFGAEPNFKDVEGVTILKVKDFSAGQDLGLVYNLSNKEHPLVTAASEYAGTDEWTKTIQEHGYYPPTR